MNLKLSMQDLVPVAEGKTAAESLGRLGELAVLGDELGYERLWYAEHHGMASIASSSPEVLIAHAAAKTRRIRIGAGGVMLPNHVPLRVAETYRTLEALHPGRIDLGIGRAGGADERALRALRSAGGERFPNLMSELMAFEDASEDEPFGGVPVTPGAVSLPPIWILGSSGASAAYAGANGFGYAFASHFSPAPAAPAFAAYREAFRPGAQFAEPHAILCVAAIAAPTQEEADWLAGSTGLAWLYLARGQSRKIPAPQTAADYPYTDSDRALIADRRALTLVGAPDFVRSEIEAKAESAEADEVMIATLIHGAEERLRSYRLIAGEFGLASR